MHDTQLHVDMAPHVGIVDPPLDVGKLTNHRVGNWSALKLWHQFFRVLLKT